MGPFTGGIGTLETLDDLSVRQAFLTLVSCSRKLVRICAVPPATSRLELFLPTTRPPLSAGTAEGDTRTKSGLNGVSEWPGRREHACASQDWCAPPSSRFHASSPINCAWPMLRTSTGQGWNATSI